MKLKTLILSDLHLLNNKSHAVAIYNFLDTIESADHIILNGDFIDLWRLQLNKLVVKQQFVNHIKILRKLFKFITKGSKITLVVGNHDMYLDNLIDIDNESIEITDHLIWHNYLVMHGHQFDLVSSSYSRLGIIADWFYELFINLNRLLAKASTSFGYKFWSLLQRVKLKVKSINGFNHSVPLFMKKHHPSLSGIIVGHTHSIQNEVIDGVHILNTGAWVGLPDQFGAIIENEYGICSLVNVSETGQIISEKIFRRG